MMRTWISLETVILPTILGLFPLLFLGLRGCFLLGSSFVFSRCFCGQLFLYFFFLPPNHCHFSLIYVLIPVFIFVFCRKVLGEFPSFKVSSILFVFILVGIFLLMFLELRQLFPLVVQLHRHLHLLPILTGTSSFPVGGRLLVLSSLVGMAPLFPGVVTAVAGVTGCVEVWWLLSFPWDDGCFLDCRPFSWAKLHPPLLDLWQTSCLSSEG